MCVRYTINGQAYLLLCNSMKEKKNNPSNMGSQELVQTKSMKKSSMFGWTVVGQELINRFKGYLHRYDIINFSLKFYFAFNTDHIGF